MLMRSLISRAAALAFAAALFQAAPAATFTGLYVFGDSLSDRGNTSAATFDLYPGSGYADGRLSNGPLWVETLAEDHLGLSAPTPSLAGGTNYAYAGAATDLTGLDNPFTPFVIPSLTVQTTGFLAGGGSFAADDLVIVWGGANDFVGGNQTDPAVSVQNLSAIISSLAGAGASTILVPNLPDLGDTPRSLTTGDPAAISTLTQSFNTLLSLELAALETAHPGLDLVPVDIYSLGKELLANPGAYGFTNTTDPARGLGSADGYLYWDDLHPTTATHALFAREAALALGLPIPEPGVIIFLATAGLSVAFHRRRVAWAALL